jgi:hypothetical protein
MRKAYCSQCRWREKGDPFTPRCRHERSRFKYKLMRENFDSQAELATLTGRAALCPCETRNNKNDCQDFELKQTFWSRVFTKR